MDPLVDENNAGQKIIEALQQRRYRDAERGAIAEIRNAPLVPQTWVLLGEALLHQGFGSSALRVFQRAWLLDPQAYWVDGVLRSVRRAPSGASRYDIVEPSPTYLLTSLEVGDSFSDTSSEDAFAPRRGQGLILPPCPYNGNPFRIPAVAGVIGSTPLCGP